MIISSEIQFDQVWSILDRSDSIWSKKKQVENQWVFHQKLKMWKKSELWDRKCKKERAKSIDMYTGKGKKAF
jgi:hypothetical protein